jgi:hypothetical protein
MTTAPVPHPASYPTDAAYSVALLSHIDHLNRLLALSEASRAAAYAHLAARVREDTDRLKQHSRAA